MSGSAEACNEVVGGGGYSGYFADPDGFSWEPRLPDSRRREPSSPRLIGVATTFHSRTPIERSAEFNCAIVYGLARTAMRSWLLKRSSIEASLSPLATKIGSPG